MPTILEHLAALFDKDMRAVLSNPRAISMIANPSARVQMAAVRRDRSVICFIEKPTEKVQLTAVRNAPHNIHFITSPSERVQLTVIGIRPSYVGFIPNPTEKVQLKAVEKRPECIFLLQKPAEKVQLTAVLKDPRYLSAIREPTEKVQLAAVQKNPECIRHIAEPTEKVQHMAVQRSPDIFRQIRQPEESVRLAAVQAKGENIRYVSAPSEAVQLAAVRNDPMNIRYIENPTEKVQSVVLNADRDAAPFISSPTEEIKRLAMEMYGLRLENAAGKEAAAARTSETSGDSGKKAAEDVAKKPSAKQVREAVEKLDSEIREINREYFQATYEAQYSDNAAERESEVGIMQGNVFRQRHRQVEAKGQVAVALGETVDLLFRLAAALGQQHLGRLDRGRVERGEAIAGVGLGQNGAHFVHLHLLVRLQLHEAGQCAGFDLVHDVLVSFRAYDFFLGLTMSRQSRSPRFRPRMSTSAVATLLANGICRWSHRRAMRLTSSKLPLSASQKNSTRSISL